MPATAIVAASRIMASGIVTAVVTVGVVTVGVDPASAGIVMRRQVPVRTSAETHRLRVHARIVAVLAGRGMVAVEIGWRAIHRIGVTDVVHRQTKGARAGTDLLWGVVGTPAELLLQIRAELVSVAANRESSLNDLEHR